MKSATVLPISVKLVLRIDAERTCHAKIHKCSGEAGRRGSSISPRWEVSFLDTSPITSWSRQRI